MGATSIIALCACALAPQPRSRGTLVPRALAPRTGISPPRAAPLAAATTDGDEADAFDVVVIGAGIGGLAAAAVLTQVYGRKVCVLEEHYAVGGVAHDFELDGLTFDAGPTIVLGCSSGDNPLAQVLAAAGVARAVEWAPYDGWGMVVPEAEAPETNGAWDLRLGAGVFEAGPLRRFGGPNAQAEFTALREATAPLAAGALIPALAMRADGWSLLPLLRHAGALFTLLSQGAEAATGPFAPYLDGPACLVTDQWLRAWLDALAFSLSGLPAARTPAAAMAAVLADLHRDGVSLDYPKGGFGSIAAALAAAVDGSAADARTGAALGGLRVTGSRVVTRARVAAIDFDGSGRACGVTLASGRRVRAARGVICNAPVWSLASLLRSDAGAAGGGGGSAGAAPAPAAVREFAAAAGRAEMTRSFLHLHVGLDTQRPTPLDLAALRPHYTIMLDGLTSADPCAELNMVALSNPGVLAPELRQGARGETLVVHAYGAGAAAARARALAGVAPGRACACGVGGAPHTPAAHPAPPPRDPSSSDDALAARPISLVPLLLYCMCMRVCGCVFAAAGNEPFEAWEDLAAPTGGPADASAPAADSARARGAYRRAPGYAARKEERARRLWAAVERVIPDARERARAAHVGSPLTHAFWNRRPRGTYGAAVEDLLPSGAVPGAAGGSLLLCGDGVFPGIGVPAVALNGASAANALVGPLEHWRALDRLSDVAGGR